MTGRFAAVVIAGIFAIPLRALADGPDLPPIAPASVEEAAAAIPNHDVTLTCYATRHSHADGPIASLSVLHDSASRIIIEGQPFCPAWAMCQIATERKGDSLIVSGVDINGTYRATIKLDFSTGVLAAEGSGMEIGWAINAICRVKHPDQIAQ